MPGRTPRFAAAQVRSFSVLRQLTSLRSGPASGAPERGALLPGRSWAGLGVLAFSFTFPATVLAIRGFDPVAPREALDARRGPPPAKALQSGRQEAVARAALSELPVSPFLGST